MVAGWEEGRRRGSGEHTGRPGASGRQDRKGGLCRVHSETGQEKVRVLKVKDGSVWRKKSWVMEIKKYLLR